VAGGALEQTPEERLARAAALIEGREYDSSIEDIAGAVEADEEYVERAEELFQRIRGAREEWLEIGDVVIENLNRLRDPELPPEEVLPAAVDTLAAVRQMDAVYPNPNPEDAEIISDLNARVSLTVDQQRFRFLVEQAAELLADGDYVEAVQTYIEGAEEDFGDLTAEEQALVTRENGLDLQRSVFESDAATLADERLAAARERMRELATGDPENLVAPFVELAPVAQEEVAALNATFAAGDFANAEALIADYIPTLRSVLDLYDELQTAASIIEEQEATNAQRLLDDPDYEYDWHTRFVSDLVLGRRTPDGQDRLPEGIMYTAEQVRSIALDGPAETTVFFAANAYEEAIALLLAFPWGTSSSPEDDAAVAAHIAEVLPVLERAETAAFTAVEIINAADELDLGIVDSQTISGPAPAAYSPVLDARAEIGDESRRVLLGEAAVLLISTVDLRRSLVTFAELFDQATPLVSLTDSALLADQRSAIRAPLEELNALVASWESVPVDLRTEFAREHGEYINSLVNLGRAYEIEVAAEIARLEVDSLEERLADLQNVVDQADEDLSVTIVLPDTEIEQLRPRSGAARDALLPLVGSVSGIEIQEVDSGQLVGLREAAIEVATSFADDVVYVSTEPRVQAEEATARAIAEEIGSRTTGLLAEAVSLAELALERVSVAEESESAGRAAVARVAELVAQANAASDAGAIGTASELLGDAQTLLSSDNPSIVDAGDLFQTSLSNWYRPEVEEFWNSQQVSLNTSVVEAQQTIVFVQVEQLSADAQEALAGQQFADALGILEQAEEIWSNVFPTTVNRTLTALLRQARTGFDQEASRVLREDMPGYSRLSRTLTNAYIAYDDGAYAEARSALAVFFNEQPLNFEARLLEVRLTLATAQGNADAVVNELIEGALEAVDLSTARLRAIDPYTISNAEATAALELEARLTAIGEVVEETGAATQAVQQRIDSLLALTDEVLRPPAILPDPPVDLVAEANQLISRAEAFGDWAVLPRAQQEEVLRLIERALELVPGYPLAVQRWQQIVALIGGRQTLPASGQAVLQEAITLRNQRLISDALTLLEDYLDVNPNAVLNKEFNDLLNQLRDAERGR
jgi:hypothetical protein